MTVPRPGFVIGLHPGTSSLGWIVFEGPFAPHDWGIADARKGDKNAKCIAALERLLKRYHPDAIVLEAFERRHSARADRISRLGRAMVALAAERSIEVAIYTRGEVKACFASVGAVSRHEVAEAVARSVPALAHRMPRPRRAWNTDHPRMPLFSAAALALTHYQYCAANLLSDLLKKKLDDRGE